MLTFLRKIRKSLIDSGSARRYILYAIGEIILVVIGILIALQINTWNQERINREEEGRIHQAIADKMHQNRFQLEMGVERYHRVTNSAKRLLLSVEDPSIEISTDQYAIDINNLTKRFLLGKSNKTNIYDELIASGQMKLITNPELTERLTSLKLQMELLAAYEDLQSRYVDSELVPFLNKHADRFRIYTQIAETDTLYLDKLYQAHFPVVDKSSDTPYLNSKALKGREFSNLLFELIRQTTKLLPIYQRIEENIDTIDELVSDA